MELPYCKEISENVRRTAEKGKRYSLDPENPLFAHMFLDLFQHILDENERLYNELQKS